MNIKGKLTLCFFCLLLTTLVISPVFAAKPVNKLTGGGWYLSNLGGVDNNQVSFGVQAKGDFDDNLGFVYDNGVEGRGSFTDHDYKLKAILVVTGGAYSEDYVEVGATWVGLTGTARVSVDNGEWVERPFMVAFGRAIKGERTDRVYFTIPSLSYLAWGDLVGGNVIFH